MTKFIFTFLFVFTVSIVLDWCLHGRVQNLHAGISRKKETKYKFPSSLRFLMLLVPVSLCAYSYVRNEDFDSIPNYAFIVSYLLYNIYSAFYFVRQMK